MWTIWSSLNKSDFLLGPLTQHAPYGFVPWKQGSLANPISLGTVARSEPFENGFGFGLTSFLPYDFSLITYLMTPCSSMAAREIDRMNSTWKWYQMTVALIDAVCFIIIKGYIINARCYISCSSNMSLLWWFIDVKWTFTRGLWEKHFSSIMTPSKLLASNPTWI